jgi:hypothetical protein
VIPAGRAEERPPAQARSRSATRPAPLADIDNLKAALTGVDAAGAFLSAASPGVISLFFRNALLPAGRPAGGAITSERRFSGTVTGGAFMDPISTEISTSPDLSSSDVRSHLTIDGDRKRGVYGAYWSIVIAPDGNLPPIRATLSEKVWAKAGLPPPDSTTGVRVTARRNANGRWNVTEVEAGLRELKVPHWAQKRLVTAFSAMQFGQRMGCSPGVRELSSLRITERRCS